MTREMEQESFGLGLRAQHFSEILESTEGAASGVDWFEAISENFIGVGGMPRRNLERVREQYPLVLHGVSLSIGGTDPLDTDYLNGLKTLIDDLEPALVSDHLCWTGVHGVHLHDLLPLPMTQQTVRHVADRVTQVQDFLGRRILLENASTYVTFAADEMTEWEFVTAIAEAADCHLLLDVNNIYVSSVNNGFDPLAYLDGIPAGRVRQIHLAGHQHNGDHIIDTHDAPVAEAVWDLYSTAIAQLGPVPTMIERDDHIPPFAEMVQELIQARSLCRAALREAAA
ncbi:MAG: DUF692 domain-containing protein [Magnetospiraceae bacterium]